MPIWTDHLLYVNWLATTGWTICDCDCTSEGPGGVCGTFVDNVGLVCDIFIVSPHSVASNSRAVWIARHTHEKVENGTGLSAI
jgi:hypothetical protein